MERSEISNSAVTKVFQKNLRNSVTGILLITNVFIFIVTIILQLNGIDLANWGGLHFFLAKDFYVYQLVTYLFLHASLWHLFSNMVFLWLFGLVVEKSFGARRFAIYYIVCGIIGGILQEATRFWAFYNTISEQDPTTTLGTVFEAGKQLATDLNSWITIGSSSSVCAVVLAFGILFSHKQVFSIKVKWIIIAYVLLEILAFIVSFDNGAYAAQLGAMLCGFVILCFWKNKKESVADDDIMIDWAMKILLVVVGINIVYLFLDF